MNIIDEIDSWIKKEYKETSDPFFHVNDLMRMIDEVRERSGIRCPFCGENDFDPPGFKSHILRDCEEFSETENIPRI